MNFYSVSIPFQRNLLIGALSVICFSCLKNDALPRVENISTGGKWTLKIGSTPQQVYAQLQQLNKEKSIGAVAVVYRKPFTSPAEIQPFLRLYHALTLQHKSGVVDRVMFQMADDKIQSIQVGSALLNEVSHWPLQASATDAITVNDALDIFYNKLLAVCRTPPYNDYEILLPDKPLDLAFDADMIRFAEWGFAFEDELTPAKRARSAVRLFFNNEKLVRIRHEYSEADVYN